MPFAGCGESHVEWTTKYKLWRCLTFTALMKVSYSGGRCIVIGSFTAPLAPSLRALTCITAVQSAAGVVTPPAGKPLPGDQTLLVHHTATKLLKDNLYICVALEASYRTLRFLFNFFLPLCSSNNEAGFFKSNILRTPLAACVAVKNMEGGGLHSSRQHQEVHCLVLLLIPSSRLTLASLMEI